MRKMASIACAAAVVGAAILGTTTGAFAGDPYEAIISCGQQGQHINIVPCFTDTELKVTKGNRSKIYRAVDLQQLGSQYEDGLHISLPEEFQITAQNSHGSLILTLIIVDSSGEILFEDQASQYGVVLAWN